MKKVLALLVGVSMVFAFAGNALALYDKGGNINMAVYNETLKIERLYDLGKVGVDFNFTDENVILETGVVVTDMLELGYWGGAPELTSVPQGGFDGIFASTSATTAVADSTSANSFNSAATTIRDYALAEGAEHSTEANGAFVDSMGGTGNYNTYNLNAADGVANIATLAGAGYVDMYLYYFGYDMMYSYGLIEGVSAPYQAVLRLTADGDVILNPTQIPVPAAVWLLASGLLGMVGLRRKNA